MIGILIAIESQAPRRQVIHGDRSMDRSMDRLINNASVGILL